MMCVCDHVGAVDNADDVQKNERPVAVTKRYKLYVLLNTGLIVLCLLLLVGLAVFTNGQSGVNAIMEDTVCTLKDGVKVLIGSFVGAVVGKSI